MEKLITKLTKISKKNKSDVYLVGGIVRDKLLKLKNTGNPDIAVEGDGIAFAKLVQKELGGKLIPHPEFGTALLISESFRIDIAGCREEVYNSPAELPMVKQTTLLCDLKRRDFTINAMAINLHTKELTDIFNGKKDLKLKLIRVLHSKSFEDDPTRIFRAVRFAGRLSFKLEHWTEGLVKSAIAKGLIQKLSPARLRNEIVLILKEPRRYEILRVMESLGVLKIAGLKMPEKKVFMEIDKVEVENNWFMYFCAICDYRHAAKTMNLTSREIWILTSINMMFMKVFKLKSMRLPSHIYKLLEDVPEEALMFVSIIVPAVQGKIEKFLKVYKDIHPAIEGVDLDRLGIPPGPLYKKILTEVLWAKLDGKVKTKKDEITFVKQLIIKEQIPLEKKSITKKVSRN